MKSLPIRIAILISGGGSTLKNLLKWKEQGKLDVEPVVVVSSRSGVRGIEIAEEHHLPVHVITTKRCVTAEEFSNQVFTVCRQYRSDLVVMGGFLSHLLIPSDFQRRVMNIHPSLIPSFCGKGFYGNHVHQAALEYGVKISGCTVHFVDNHYDHGPVILQKHCQVLPDDTQESLQARVFELECEALPKAIQAFADNRIRWRNDHQHVDIVDLATSECPS